LSAAQFVRQVLEEKTIKHQKLVDEILEREAKIQKEYDGEGENGQRTVRRSSPPDAGKASAKNRKNKGEKTKS